MLALATAAGCRPTAWHVDHGLRAGSERDAEVVAAAADRLGVTARSVRAPVAPGPNLEARARQARAEALGADVVTGHTMDDAAETVLLNLLRGTGADGLRGPDPRRRPILGLRRRETRDLCRSLGLGTVDDPSNADPVHRRNRVRHEVLPLLDDVADRDVAAVIARQCALHAEEVSLLDELAAAIDPTDVAALRAAPRPLARRALRRWLRTRHPPSSADVERVLGVVDGEAIATQVTGRRIARHQGTLQIS